MEKPDRCDRCQGCGKITNTKEGEPWTHWAFQPPEVLRGRAPIDCPDCGGTGHRGDFPRAT